MKKFTIFLILIIGLFSCKKEDKFDGLWVGASYELDTDYYTPLVNYLNAKNDSSLEVGIVGNKTSKAIKWYQNKGKLYIDTNRFLPSQYQFDSQFLTFNNPYKSQYFKAEKVKLNQKVSNSYFVGKTFISEYDTIQFIDESKMFIRNNNVVEQACYFIWEKEERIFLVKKGSTFNCDRNYRFTEQIVSVEKDSFAIKRWENNGLKTVKYSLLDTEVKLTPDDFQLCNSYLYRNNPRHRYYYKGVFYKGGNYKIEKLFHQNFKSEDYVDISGLLQLEFIVNCKGEAGRFKLKQFNLDFELVEFPSALQDKIMAFGKSLHDWNPGKNDKGEIIDTYRFLNFKFKDGELVEIFP